MSEFEKVSLQILLRTAERTNLFSQSLKIFDLLVYRNDKHNYASQFHQAFLEEVQDLLSRGIPLDGIGVQGHFTGHVNPTLLQVNTLTVVFDTFIMNFKVGFYLPRGEIVTQTVRRENYGKERKAPSLAIRICEFHQSYF